MGNPYTSVSILSYNANPPADDGSEVPSNRVDWATGKTKLGDPLKTAIESMNTNIGTAFGKVVGGGGVTTTAIDYTVGASDAGKLVKVTAAATITTPDATVVTSPFVFSVSNLHSAAITLDGSGSQTIDGQAGLSVPPGVSFFLYTDGTNWFTAGRSIPAPMPAAFKNLSIKVASNTTVTVAADFVTVTSGANFQTVAVSSTINFGTTGADALDASTIAIDTWYAIWVIAKADGTTKCLASTSATSPTMPTDYTFKARVGWVRTIHGSATLYGTWQFGRRAQYKVGLAQTSVIPVIANASTGTFSTTSPTLAAASVSSFVPSTASIISVIGSNQWTGATVSNVLVAPSTSYGGTNNGPIGSNGQFYPIYLNASAADSQTASIVLEGTSLGWCASNDGGAIGCLGWEDNI